METLLWISKSGNWQETILLIAIVGIVISLAVFFLIIKLIGVDTKVIGIGGHIDEIKTGISQVHRRMGQVELTIAGLAQSNSPRILTPKGEEILRASRIDAIVENRLSIIIEKVKALNPQNAFQAEENVIDVVSELQNDPTLTKVIENGAFVAGTTPDVVLLVGAIFIRQKVLEPLGFAEDQIDLYKSDVNTPG